MATILNRVRTILVLGYWVLGNIHRYWIVLLLGDICCCSDTQYNTNQAPVSTIHTAFDLYSDAIVCLATMLICCCLLDTIIVIIIEFWDFSWSLLVSVLVLSIGIARCQYYWVLDIGCLSWYRSNPNLKSMMPSLYMFTWWTILPNFVPIRFDTMGFFEEHLPNKKIKNNRISSDMRSVPDPLVHKLVSYIIHYPCNNFLSYTSCHCTEYSIVNCNYTVS